VSTTAERDIVDIGEAPPRHDPPAPAGRRRRWDRFTPYILITPAIVLLVALLAYPLYRMAVVSL